MILLVKRKLIAVVVDLLMSGCVEHIHIQTSVCSNKPFSEKLGRMKSVQGPKVLEKAFSQISVTII